MSFCRSFVIKRQCNLLEDNCYSPEISSLTNLWSLVFIYVVSLLSYVHPVTQIDIHKWLWVIERWYSLPDQAICLSSLCSPGGTLQRFYLSLNGWQLTLPRPQNEGLTVGEIMCHKAIIVKHVIKLVVIHNWGRWTIHENLCAECGQTLVNSRQCLQ